MDSAIVCSRNRPRSLVNAVRALLSGGGDALEVIVVDQSDGDETERALDELSKDARLVYRRSRRRGKGAALNEGIELARGEIIVCTDDDCEAPPGWVSAMAAELRAYPKAAICFCRVAAVAHDENAGYVPVYDVESTRVLTSVTEVRRGVGLGAAMAIRREFAQSMRGFDESFGPGARFPSGDDWDLAIRALLNGWQVVETPALTVVHDGFRSFAEGREHARRDWLALGAVSAKPLRAGHLGALVIPLAFFPRKALWPPVSDLLHLRRPRGIGRVTAFVRGFAAGLTTPVDSATLRFVPRSR